MSGENRPPLISVESEGHGPVSFGSRSDWQEYRRMKAWQPCIQTALVRVGREATALFA